MLPGPAQGGTFFSSPGFPRDSGSFYECTLKETLASRLLYFREIVVGGCIVRLLEIS